jgi:2-polyprenyl-6-methoxyphenol hydroxylase-like FAD-dependent oxidoreductase
VIDEVVDVLIVGAGPTGLTLAAQLDAVGARFRIIDRQPDRVHESRALAIQPRTLEVLRALGIAATLVERGNDAVALCMHFGDRVVPMRLFDIGLDDTAYPFLLFISQAETEAVLNEHLNRNGVRVERSVEFLGFTAGSDDVTCTLRHRDGTLEEIRSRYLVGCDGAHSAVRCRAGIDFEGETYPQTFALADLEVDGDLEPGAVHAFLGEQGILLFFPLVTPATWRMIGIRPAQPAAAASDAGSEEASLNDLQVICDGFAGGRLRLRDPVWATYFRLHRRQAAHYRAGRVFLAGDAAHVHSPAGAQGMNTGIQDAWNLGWKLALVARGAAREALLDSYEPERMPVGSFVLRFSDRASSVAVSGSRIVRLIRTRVAPRLVSLFVRLRWPRARGFRTISQLAIAYRDSPAVEEGQPRPRRGPKAGDRLPDQRVRRDGHEVWLQDALASPGFHLLLCGPGDWPSATLSDLRTRYGERVTVHRLSREPTPGVLQDPDGHALARLGAQRPVHYLLRPDGHVGYRAGGTDLRGAETYLARWLSAVDR